MTKSILMVEIQVALEKYMVLPLLAAFFWPHLANASLPRGKEITRPGESD